MCLHNLDGVALEEGGSLRDFPGASLDECRTHCETNPSYKSFAFSVENKNCHLKDKTVQKGSTPSKPGWKDYRTYYIEACASNSETASSSTETPTPLPTASSAAETPISLPTESSPTEAHVRRFTVYSSSVRQRRVES